MIPDTQRAGYRFIIAHLPECEAAVLAFVRSNPGVTRNEIDLGLGDGRPNASASRRLSGLEAKGWIERSSVARVCPITGRRAAAWFAVRGEPKPVDRAPRTKPAVALKRIAAVLATAQPWVDQIEQVRAIVDGAVSP